jgi:hypothetical protein
MDLEAGEPAEAQAEVVVDIPEEVGEEVRDVAAAAVARLMRWL